MATIYDVAKAAGVSPKTVSRVLNNDGPVNVATREAVERAMSDLGYIPSNAARMMRSSRSGLIGLITGAITMSPEPTQPSGLPALFIVQVIQNAVSTSGRTLMIADTGGTPDRVPDLVQTFLEHRVEGLIYVAEYHQHVRLPPIPPKIPTVLVNCFDDAGTACILPDDRRGQYDLVQRIIDAGHRRIAYLTLRPDIVATALRTAGYRDALQSRGIEFDPALMEAIDLRGRADDIQFLWSTIDRMLSLPEPPTVFCCGNDMMALSVYGILRSRGLQVPDQISVAGYDNYRAISETLFPQLTTVDLPYGAMGIRAAYRLLAMISGDARNSDGPEIIAGPVFWRNSVTERRSANVSRLTIVREEPK